MFQVTDDKEFMNDHGSSISNDAGSKLSKFLGYFCFGSLTYGRCGYNLEIIFKTMPNKYTLSIFRENFLGWMQKILTDDKLKIDSYNATSH